MAGAAGGIVSGVASIPTALRLLRTHRELWPLCLLPLALNLLFFGAAIALFAAMLDPAVASLRTTLEVADPETWYAWIWVGPLRVLAWLVRWLLLGALALCVYFCFTLIGSVIAAPFLDRLSDRVECLHAGRAVAAQSAGLRGALAAIGSEAKRVAFFAAVQFGWLALGLVPGLQPVSAVGLLGSAALFLPLEYSGYLLDRRGISFAERRAWLWRNRVAMAGFGGAALGTFLIPGLNFFCLPLLVTAGTQLALENDPPEPQTEIAG
jgi:CysZ protein